MLRHNYLAHKCFSWLHKLKSYLWKAISENQVISRIEKIDTEKHIVIIHTSGVSSPITFHLTEIIHDIVIIASLPPNQASLIGYYFGIYYENNLKEKTHLNFNATHSYFSLNDSKAKFKLISQDRFGNISYSDKTRNIVMTRSIMDIILTSALINSFSPIEACYLGILTGIDITKKKNRKVKSDLTHHSTVI